MAKINFTQEHDTQLKNLCNKMLFDNITIKTPMGQTLGISELLHTTTINTLNSMRASMSKKIETKEATDEWGITENERKNLDELKFHKELINLIIGWKRKNIEISENQKLKKNLEAELHSLKESTKTPEDKIKEIEQKLQQLDTF